MYLFIITFLQVLWSLFVLKISNNRFGEKLSYLANPQVQIN